MRSFVLLTTLLVSLSPGIARAHLSLIRQGADSRGTIETGDRHGEAVAVGDFNRDGYDDVAMGAPGEDVNSATDGGAVIVNYGSANGITNVGSTLVTPSTIGQVEVSGAGFGRALATGDFNGDLYDDLVIGAPYEDVSGHDRAGRFYVVYGSSAGLVTSTAYSEAAAGGGVEALDQFGWSFAVGRFNSDAYDDLAVGAPGEDASAGTVAVNFLGSAAGLTTASASFVKQTAYGGTNVAGDQFGYALAAGNILGTANDDLAIGTPFRDPALTDAGVVYLVQGAAAGLSTSSALVEGAVDKDSYQASGHFGFALTIGTFFSGSYRSLAIGEPGRHISGFSSAGRVLVARGGLSGIDLIGAQILTQNSGAAGTLHGADRFGEALACGEFGNADGYDDIAVGSPKDGLGFSFHAGYFQVFPTGPSGPSGGGWSAYNQRSCNELIESDDAFGSAIAYGRFDATDRGGFVVGAPGEGYEKVYGVTVPTVASDAGLVHVIAPWRQVFNLSCRSSLVTDCAGNVVFSQEPFERVKIGSTTKIMTVLLACEHVQNGFDQNTLYTVPGWVADEVGGSQVPLFAGETLRFIDLMYTCLMLSGNDAAHAIADALYGPGQGEVTVTAFVAEMQQRAQQIGMTRTHFNNPAGLDHGPIADLGEPFSTAEDMAKLSRVAMANPLFRQIAGTLEYAWERDFGSIEFPMVSKNIYDGILTGVPNGNGIKGGCTKGAQLAGCYSGQPPSKTTPVIATSFITPLVAPACSLGNPSYVSDASSLIGLGTTICNAPFVPIPPQAYLMKLFAADLPTKLGKKSAAQGEMISAVDPVVDLFRQEGTGSTSLDFELLYVAEMLIGGSGSETFGITPFTGHGPIVLTNQDSIPRTVEVTRSTDGLRTRYALPAYGSATIPAFSGAPITGLTVAIDNPDIKPLELTIEIPYRYHVVSPGTSPAPFFTARPRRPRALSEGLTLTTTGTDPNAGSFVYAAVHAPSQPVDVPGSIDAPSARVALRPAFPNPFRDRTRITFELPRPANASLVVYNVAGRLVRRAVQDDLPAGAWGFDWDGRDDQGFRMGAGMYFYRLEVDGRVAGRGHVVLSP